MLAISVGPHRNHFGTYGESDVDGLLSYRSVVEKSRNRRRERRLLDTRQGKQNQYEPAEVRRSTELTGNTLCALNPFLQNAGSEPPGGTAV
jgi:hypothetical protein